MMDLLNEKVKVAEEEAQVHARKNFEATEEIRRVRATAVKVSLVGMYCTHTSSMRKAISYQLLLEVLCVTVDVCIHRVKRID
jgi:hypothetical protein